MPPRSKAKMRIGSSVALLSTLIASAACTRGSDSPYFGTTKPRHGPDEIWINNSGEAEWLDPGKISGSIGGEVVWNIFCGLARWHPKTLETTPGIANRLRVSEDGRTYTFGLRTSKWSDGRPLTAEDFEWTFKRILDPKTASKYASLLYIIENAAPFNQRALMFTGPSSTTAVDRLRAAVEKVAPVEKVRVSERPVATFVFLGGKDKTADRKKVIAHFDNQAFEGAKLSVKITDRSVVGVKTLAPDKLQVKLKDPVPFFMNVLPFYTFMPVPRHVIEKLEKEGKNPDLWTRPEYIVSNGAYVLKEWKFRQYMVFEKNPHYWDVANVRVPRVRTLMIESYNTTLNMYRAGELDWIGHNSTLPAEFMDHLTGFKDFKLDPKMTIYWYWLNTTKKPLDDPRVRKALSLAIDRTAIVKHVTRAGQVPTADIVPDGLAGYEGLRSTTYDLRRAKALLAEAGFPNGKGWPVMTLTYNTSESHRQIAEAVQQMWKKNLGIRVEIENQEWKVYLKNLKVMNYDIGRLGWTGDYADPYTFLEVFTKHNGNNHSGWSDEGYEAKLAEGNRLLDPKLRMAKLREAEAMFEKDTPVIPLYVYTRSYTQKPYLKGLWANYLDRHPWQYLHIDERWYDGVPTSSVADPPPPVIRFEEL